jgi:hypothetical protein
MHCVACIYQCEVLGLGKKTPPALAGVEVSMEFATATIDVNALCLAFSNTN